MLQSVCFLVAFGRSGLGGEVGAAMRAKNAERGDFIATVAAGVNAFIFYIDQGGDGEDNGADDSEDEEQTRGAGEYADDAGDAAAPTVCRFAKAWKLASLLSAIFFTMPGRSLSAVCRSMRPMRMQRRMSSAREMSSLLERRSKSSISRVGKAMGIGLVAADMRENSTKTKS